MILLLEFIIYLIRYWLFTDVIPTQDGILPVIPVFILLLEFLMYLM